MRVETRVNLQQLDLNLLLLFDTLYQLRSVSRAAEQLCISQSAFSHSLARLRESLQDPLFVRVGQEMQPTLRAEQISGKLRESLTLLSQALQAPVDFDPLKDTANFTIVGTDYTEFCILPRMLNGMRGQLGQDNIHFKLLSSLQRYPQQQLAEREVDFVFGFEHGEQSMSGIEHMTLFEDEYCTIARKDHRALKDGLSLSVFLQLQHVRVSPWGESQGIVDIALQHLKQQRSVLIQLPNVWVASQIIAESDMLLTMPKRMALQLIKYTDFTIYQPPLALPRYQIKLYWHKLNTARASHRWFRKQIEKHLK